MDPREYDGSKLTPDVQVRVGDKVTVTTYAGPKVICRVDAIRKLKSGLAYDVTPLEDKTAEFKRAGVPTGGTVAQFVAFDFQIAPIQPAMTSQAQIKGTSTVIRRKSAATECSVIR